MTITHPLDKGGKWSYLSEGCIIKAPVPSAMTPKVNLVSQSSGYDVYKVIGGRLRLRTGPSYDHKILKLYPTGTEIIVLNKTSSSWFEVSCPDGKRGYMDTDFLEYHRTEGHISSATGQVVKPKQLREQLFRIYQIIPDMEKITVHARHIFYDLLDNMIKKIEPSSSTIGAKVVEQIDVGCLSPHDFTFYSDLESTAEDVILENINPVEVLLGDGGVAEKYLGELARDWWDVYVVKRVGLDTNVQIREGKNLLGISYEVDTTAVVTRIMPTGEDADGNILYLPELYVDSPYINNFIHPKWVHLAVSSAKEVVEGDERRSKEQCYTEMRKACSLVFEKGCDLPTITLDVDFINLCQTEEYKQYDMLQNIYLGDTVSVLAKRIGVSVAMRMTAYTYDCLTEKYVDMTLGTLADTLSSGMITAGQIPSGSISGGKLCMNAVGAGQLQNGSVNRLHIQMGAIDTAHIQNAAIVNALIADATITKAKIAEATVGQLNADVLNAITARIKELSTEHLVTDELYASLATIATAQITSANIDSANISWADIGGLAAEIATIAVAQMTTANINQATIDWANIANLNTQMAKIALAQITSASIEQANIDWANIGELNTAIANVAVAQLTTAHLQEANIDWASIEELNAGIATLVQANIGNANIDWARIKDLTTGTAIIEKGINGKLYVADLAVTEANMASLTVGELIVRGEDGCFYSVTIASDGSVTTEKKQVGNNDIVDASVSGGKLIEHTITARELNVQSIFADEALIGAITAANINVSDLMASEAFISTLNTMDISGNTSLRLVVDTAKDEALDAVGDTLSQITLTADGIRNEVKANYAPVDEVSQMKETLSTLSEQTEENFTWAVTKVNEIIEDAASNQTLTNEQLSLIRTYMTFDEDGLTIGKSGNPFTFRVVNDRLAFYMNNTEVAYLSNNKLYVTQAEILTKLQIGKFAYEPQQNGNLSVIYTG